MRIAFVNARLVDPLSQKDMLGGIIVEDGIIKNIEPNLKSSKNALASVKRLVDCQGHMLIPSLIDARCHCREPGEEHKETLETAFVAAAKGGIASIIQRPDTIPAIDDVSMVERMVNLSQKQEGVRLYPMGALTKGLEGKNLTEIGLMQQAGAVGFGDADQPIRSARLMRRALQYSSQYNTVIVQMPQEAELTASGVMNGGALATRLGLAGIADFAEVMQIERDIRLLQSMPESMRHKTKVHFSLISTKLAVEVIAKAKKAGLNVTCDTAPHYYLMNENDVGAYRTFAKTFPPLRQEEDRKAIIEGLRSGIIDMVVSDHNPQDQDSKRLPFGEAAFGVVGLESLLPNLLKLYHQYDMSLLDVIKLATIAPATRFHLEGGQLAVGKRAELSLINIDYAWKLHEENLISKSKNTAFGGREMQGKCLFTFKENRALYADKAFAHNFI